MACSVSLYGCRKDYDKKDFKVQNIRHKRLHYRTLFLAKQLRTLNVLLTLAQTLYFLINWGEKGRKDG